MIENLRDRWLRAWATKLALLLAGLLLVGCLPEKRVAHTDEDLLTVFASEAAAFRANLDGDRTEEGSILFSRIQAGSTTVELKKILGEPSPGLSTSKQWVYELNPQETFTFEFEDGILVGSYWMTVPATPALTPPSPPAAEEQPASTTLPEQE